MGDFGSMPKEILPKNLIVSFKHDKILFDMTSAFGNSGLINLANSEKGIFDTYFSLFTIKYFYESSPGEVFPGFDSMAIVPLTRRIRSLILDRPTPAFFFSFSVSNPIPLSWIKRRMPSARPWRVIEAAAALECFAIF